MPKVQKWTLIVASLAVIAASAVVCVYIGARFIADAHPERHTLTAPVLIWAGHTSVGVLPIGTTLVLDRAMPEGFDRYLVAINAFGAPLPRSASPLPNLVEPLESHPYESGPPGQAGMTDEELVSLLRAFCVRRVDLERIAPQLE